MESNLNQRQRHYGSTILSNQPVRLSFGDNGIQVDMEIIASISHLNPNTVMINCNLKGETL